MDEPEAERLELLLLGPLRLRAEGRLLPLKTRKAWALLLLLALEGSQGRPRLCAWLWPGLDESSARRNLRRELVRLREAGAAAAVRADGDRLRPGPGLVNDFAQAESLLATGQPEAALALWQGEAAEGLESLGNNGLAGDDGLSPWLAALRHRVRALHRRAQQACADAAEARGDIAMALVHTQALLADDAMEERQHRTAMRLLAANGQREAALRQFDTCRALLAAELGLAPMPETLALAQALREPPLTPNPVAGGDTAGAGAAVAVVPPQLPFVGRGIELARLQRALTERRPVLLVGEAGVGKTRLAAEFAASQGPYALLRCQPGEAGMPLSTWAQALRVVAGDPPDLAGLEPWVVAELPRLLPELGPPPPPLGNAADRLRFDEACLRAWLQLAGDSFDVLVWDDWQWADSASRALLHGAVHRRRTQGGGAVEILTWRGEPDDPALLADAEALGADVLPLEALNEASVHELVHRLSGVADSGRFARRLRALTGGHAFFIAETLRDLAERALLRVDDAGRWFTPLAEHGAGDGDLPLPASVRDAVLARVRRLGPGTVRLLEAAALASQPFSATWLAPACALSELDALAALDDAARAHLVQACDGGGYAWAHDLARLALESSLAPTRRRLVHHRLALAAEARAAHAEAAKHFEACGEAARAVPHRLAAGDAALELRALAEAAAQWRQGLLDQPDPADEAALLARLSGVEWTLGHHDEARSLHQGLMQRLADPALHSVKRAELQVRAAEYLCQAGEAAQSLALLDAMGEPLSDELRRPWWRQRMNALHQLGRLDEALAEGQKALGMAPVGTREQGEVLVALATLARSGGRMLESQAHADAAVALFERLGDPLGQARALFYRGIVAIELADHATAERTLHRAATLSAGHGNVHLQRIALYNLAASFSNRSQPAEALAVAREAWPTLLSAPHEEITLVFRSMFIECHYQLGEWGCMWEHLVPAVEAALARSQPLTLMSIGNCALEPAAMLGQWALVQPLVQALHDKGSLDGVPVVAEILIGCAYAALVAGDPSAAAGWLARVRPEGEAEHPRVHCRAELLRVELALLGGAGAEALARVPSDDAPGMSPELRQRALLARWRAGQLARERAMAVADDPATHAGVALLLARELGGEVLERQRRRHAASLADWPAVHASFNAVWR